MTDRFFSEIEDARERRVAEAHWAAVDSSPPEALAALYGENAARDAIDKTLTVHVRPFLAMLDVALTMPEDEHRAMMKWLNNEPDDGDIR